MNELYFHEDHFRQKEILPLQDYFAVKEQLDYLDTFNDVFFTEEGFEKCVSIDIAQQGLFSLKIDTLELKETLREKSAIFYGSVSKGYPMLSGVFLISLFA